MGKFTKECEGCAEVIEFDYDPDLVFNVELNDDDTYYCEDCNTFWLYRGGNRDS